MASVRMTQELRTKIRTNAENAFNVADPIPQPTRDLQQRAVDAIRNSKFYQEVVSVNKQCIDIVERYELGSFDRDGDFRYNNKESLNFKPSIPPKTNKVTELNFTTNDPSVSSTWSAEIITINLDSPADLYNVKQYYGTNNLKFALDLLDGTNNEVAKLKNDLLAYRQSLKDRQARRNNYSSKISDLLGQCTTLKQLLEVWPAAESFVPTQYLQQLNQKVTRAERAKAVKETIDFDDTEFNQVVLTAKIMGQ